MDTIRNYIEWIERVRTGDHSGQRLSRFFHRVISKGREKAEEDAVDLERNLFLSPPNPIYMIQPFENMCGYLVSDVDSQLLVEKANEMGLVSHDEYVQGRDIKVRSYKVNGSIGSALYIGKGLDRYYTDLVKFRGSDGKLHTYTFNKPTILWICAYGSDRFRVSHDIAQPFLELIDGEEIPSVVASREKAVGASNILLENWEVKQ